MNPINRKPAPKTENIFYGVDVNDKQAVEKEYARLKKQHRKMTVIVIIILAILGGIIFDFVRVNTLGGKPIVAISEKVENGTLFSGIGYKVLYCNDGSRYIGSVLYKTCSEPEMSTYTHVVYEKIMEYGDKKKIIDKKKLSNFVINNLEFDESNSEGGSDYLLDVTYTCSNGDNRCFKTPKEYIGTDNLKMYVRINKFNEVYDIVAFKNSGIYYDTLKADFQEKVKDYLIQNELIEEESLKDFRVSLTDTNGTYRYKGITYPDTYLIKIDYSCVDYGDSCVKVFDKKDYEGDYSNLSYYASLFLDDQNNVMIVGPREYLDMD